MLVSSTEITNLKSALWLFFFQNISLVLAYLKFSGQKDFSVWVVVAPLVLGLVASGVAGFFSMVYLEVTKNEK